MQLEAQCSSWIPDAEHARAPANLRNTPSAGVRTVYRRLGAGNNAAVSSEKEQLQRLLRFLGYTELPVFISLDERAGLVRAHVPPVVAVRP